jgi:rRNA processing protein Krr1/Pno1
MSLETSEIAYLLGRNGSTKQRLANFSGARLEIDPREDGGRIEVIGTQEERELARLCVDITLQQRNNGKVQVDIEKLESRTDCTFLDVPKDAVGFILVRAWS